MSIKKRIYNVISIMYKVKRMHYGSLVPKVDKVSGLIKKIFYLIRLIIKTIRLYK